MVRDPNFIGFRLDRDIRARLVERCEAEGVTISEFLRMLCKSAVDGDVPELGDGYRQARRLAAHMAKIAVVAGLNMLPDSYEEFIERYGVGGRPPNEPDGS